jgi:hypothetical protein
MGLETGADPIAESRGAGKIGFLPQKLFGERL